MSKNTARPVNKTQLRKEWIRENRICFFSFLLPFACMMGLFIGNGVFPFGDRSFMHSDMYHQYVPFLEEFLRRVKDGEMAYSWNIGLGSNYPALYIYYCASPFNWLMLLLPSRYLIEFMSYMVVFKIGLCGFTFSYYLKHKFHSKDLFLLLFSVFYAMSGFVAAYSWNVMWIDCLFLAPLILLGLERLVLEGRPGLYCVTLFLSILSNYYLSIMICIFLVLYFFTLLPQIWEGPSIRANLPCLGRAALQFFLYSLLAGGMAAVLLIPEMTALFSTEFSQSTFPKKTTWYFPFSDVLARHCVGVERETGLDHWPNLFCSSAVFFLLPLYAFHRQIPLKEKLPRLLLCAFLIVSFCVNKLTFVWHGFNYPDSLPCRQSFLYILLVLTMGYEVVQKKEGFSLSDLSRCLFFALLFLLFSEKMVDDDAFSPEVFLLTGALVLAYALLLYAYKKYDSPSAVRLRRVMAITALGLVTFEATFNMASTGFSTTGRSAYLNKISPCKQLAARTKEADPGFYRFEKFGRTTKNDGALGDYPTASLFSSTANADISAWYDRMGMSESKVFYCFDGQTPLSAALLNVRYLFSSNDQEDPFLYTPVDSQDDITLYRCNYTLPAGFILDDAWNLNSASLEKSCAQPFELQNRMVASCGVSENLFDMIPVWEDDGRADFSPETAGHYYAYCSRSDVDEVKLSSDSLNKTFSKVHYDYILDLGYHEAGDHILLENEEEGDLGLYVALLNTDALGRALEIIGQQPFVVDSWDATHINGSVTVRTPGTLVLSVASEPGWTLQVDGKKVPVSSYDDMFLAVPLEAGSHLISLSYKTPGLAAGVPISIISLSVFVFLQIRHQKTPREGGRKRR